MYSPSQCNLQNEFQNVIDSFVDTLPLLKKKFLNRKSKVALKLTTPTTELLSTARMSFTNLIDIYMMGEEE